MPYMEEAHKLELDTFTVEVFLDEAGQAEVVFSRAAKPVFRALAAELNTALTFVEKHAEITLVQR